MKLLAIASCSLLLLISHNTSAQTIGNLPTEGSSATNISDDGLTDKNGSDDAIDYSDSTTDINNEGDLGADDYDSSDSEDGEEEEYDNNENDEGEDIEDATELVVDVATEGSEPYDEYVHKNATMEHSNLLLSSTLKGLSSLPEAMSTNAAMKGELSADAETTQTSQDRNPSQTSSSENIWSSPPPGKSVSTQGDTKSQHVETNISEEQQKAQSKHKAENTSPKQQPTQPSKTQITSTIPVHPTTSVGKRITNTFATLIKSHVEVGTEKLTTTVIPAVRQPVNKGKRPVQKRTTQTSPKKVKPMPLRAVESNLQVSGKEDK